MNSRRAATASAVLAAALYAVNVPISKFLLQHVSPTMMAAFLYLGAGLGLLAYRLFRRAAGKPQTAPPLTKKELPYTIAMIVLDIAAPILLMLGVQQTTSANVSLLNNFEIVVTSLIALFVFQEILSRRLWVAIALVTVASVILGWDGEGGFVFNQGSLLVLGACACWGFENNCTKMLSSKSSLEIVTIKGCFSGAGSFIVAILLGESLPAPHWLPAILLLGFISYGLSINFYILAQKELGAAKTSAYYSIAPFLGVAFSMFLLGERPGLQFYIALSIMAIATWLMVQDSIKLQHTHAHVHIHTHPHQHGDLIHVHEHAHTHTHQHIHQEDMLSHLHTHQELAGHDHCHT